MLIQWPDDLKLPSIEQPISRALQEISLLADSELYEIYCNGVRFKIIAGQESRARNEVIALSNLRPEDDWSFTPPR